MARPLEYSVDGRDQPRRSGRARRAAAATVTEPVPTPVAGVEAGGREAKLQLDPDYSNRDGYQPAFLEDVVVPLPTSRPRKRRVAARNHTARPGDDRLRVEIPSLQRRHEWCAPPGVPFCGQYQRRRGEGLQSRRRAWSQIRSRTMKADRKPPNSGSPKRGSGTISRRRPISTAADGLRRPGQ